MLFCEEAVREAVQEAVQPDRDPVKIFPDFLLILNLSSDRQDSKPTMSASTCRGTNSHGSPCAKKVRGKQFCAYHATQRQSEFRPSMNTQFSSESEPLPTARLTMEDLNDTKGDGITTPESHLLNLVRHFDITTRMILHIQRHFGTTTDDTSLTHDSSDEDDSTFSVASNESFATRWTVVSRPRPFRSLSIFIGGMAVTFAIMNRPIVSAVLSELSNYTFNYLHLYF